MLPKIDQKSTTYRLPARSSCPIPNTFFNEATVGAPAARERTTGEQFLLDEAIACRFFFVLLFFFSEELLTHNNHHKPFPKLRTP